MVRSEKPRIARGDFATRRLLIGRHIGGRHIVELYHCPFRGVKQANVKDLKSRRLYVENWQQRQSSTPGSRVNGALSPYETGINRTMFQIRRRADYKGWTRANRSRRSTVCI